MFYKYFAVYTDNDPVKTSVNEAAINTVKEAKALGYETCLNNHNAQWAKKWEYCDVKIEGDDEAQQALRYSIFQLLIVAPVKGSGNSIPARALSGQVYKGAIFWILKCSCFLSFCTPYPEKAVELMRYRIKTLDGARRKQKLKELVLKVHSTPGKARKPAIDACTYFNIGDPLPNEITHSLQG